MNLKKNVYIGFLLFIAVFGFYLCTVAPTVAPYRDAGEMVTVINHNGVAHPPGYPLYILAGNIFMRMVPFGNTAYTINIVSALASAGAVVCIYCFLLYMFPGAGCMLTAVFTGILVSGGNFWYLSQVSEMYSANIFACALLIGIVMRDIDDAWYFKRLILASFLAGLLLGFRMDLVLTFPALAWYTIGFLKKRKEKLFEIIIYCGIFFIIGLSVYLYLYVRSKNNPIINWGNPDTLEKLWNVISRKSHGRTLDLLSVNYAQGALFMPGMMIYIKHLFWEFTPLGIPLMLAGGYGWYIHKKMVCISLLIGFFCTGPLFIFLSNMPPNPHALAIMEPHYLLPDLFAFFLASGILYGVAPHIKKIAFSGIVILVVFNLFNFRYRSSMRWNLFAYDYVKNIFRSLPVDGLGIVKEDVQLFSLWHAQLVEKKRVQTPIVAQGLAGSDWYRKNMKKIYRDISLMPLRNPQQWEQFVRANDSRRIFVTGDVPHHGSAKIKGKAYGLLNQLKISETPLVYADTVQNMINMFYVRRGVYNYEFQLDEQGNFFNADLIEEYASAWRKLGYAYLMQDKLDRSEYCFYKAIHMKKTTPTPYYHLGYVFFKKEEYSKARNVYTIAINKYKNYIELTGEYHTLADVVAGIKKEFAEVHLHCGVVCQKLDDQVSALKHFEKAIEINPRFAQAFYNLATAYWHKDWRKVISYLEQAVFIEPGNLQYRRLLDEARKKAF